MSRRPRALCTLLVLLVTAASLASSGEPRDDLFETTRLKLGIGDRLTLRSERGGPWISGPEVALAQGLKLDFFELWLPRGWEESWVERGRLRALLKRGITPVVVHYYFGDDISKERVESQRDDWYTSLWRMARAIRMDAPVLVVLEPEFNNLPPRGETAITDWPWFGQDLSAAAKMIRREAPNALVGTCPGDFSGTPNLEAILGPASEDLDFLAFQEMRASTDPAHGRPGYIDVGQAAVDYSRYLKRAFGLPLLLAYVAVSSYGDWEERQAETLRGLGKQRAALKDAGVFGLIYFQLRDDPDHIGYFGPAERHFGLLRSDGTAKPALSAFRSLLD